MAAITITTSAYQVTKAGLREIKRGPFEATAHEIAVEVTPGRDGWYDVTVREQASAYHDHPNAYRFGYNRRDGRWSYNQAPPALILEAAREAGLPVR